MTADVSTLTTRLRELMEERGTDAADIRSLIDLYDAALRSLAEMREALDKISINDAPRTVGETYRADGVKSKMDKCSHERRMYEDCDTCIAEFAAAALARSAPEKGKANG